MWSVATDITNSVVCVSVYVGHTDELCKNGRNNRDAVWGLTHVGQRNHVGLIRWEYRSQGHFSGGEDVPAHRNLHTAGE